MKSITKYERPGSIYSISPISWGMYDLANTIFSMNVVSLYFALWIIKDLGGSDLTVALARSSAMLLVALSMPLLGGVSDRIGNRKLFILIFTFLCCLFTAFLSLPFDLIGYLLFFGAAVFCYQAALVFYNALLPDVSPLNKDGKVSGMGVALGYVGSIIGMLVIRPFVGTGDAFSRQASFLPTAVLFLILSFPLFIFVRESRKSAASPISSLKQLFITPYRVFKLSGEFPSVRRFLIARFFIVEAMETIISFMAVYIVMVGGFNQDRITVAGMDEVMFFLIIATIFAVFGSFVWGIIVDKIGAPTALTICCQLWVVTLFITAVNPFNSIFWIIGPLAGIGLGGVWTADRIWLLKMVPEERRAEFFGLYALSGRLAAVIGPIIWGLTVKLGEPLGNLKYRFAVASMSIMMLIGYLLLRKVSKEV